MTSPLFPAETTEDVALAALRPDDTVIVVDDAVFCRVVLAI